MTFQSHLVFLLERLNQYWFDEPIFSSFVGPTVFETDSELNLYISGQPKTWLLLSFRYQRSHAIWSKIPIGFSANALECKCYEHFEHWTFFSSGKYSLSFFTFLHSEDVLLKKNDLFSFTIWSTAASIKLSNRTVSCHAVCGSSDSKQTEVSRSLFEYRS